MKITTRIVWWKLVVLAAFSALSALAGGIAILATGGIGMGMPMSMLDGSPFGSFTIPGIVLLAVVGGTQVVAFLGLVLHRDWALLWAAVAGFGMVIWIVVETVVINGFSILQFVYLVDGLAELALVIALLGVVPWIPRLTRGAPPKRGSST